MNKDLVRRSKRLSLVLRHRPDSVGIALDPHGWVDVETLLDAVGMTRDELSEVVDTNDKQRFTWDLETDRIRANQGHSVDVDLALEPAEPPDVLYHGTPLRNVASILASGLERRQRHHVHLSPDTETHPAWGRDGAASSCSASTRDG